MNVWEDLLVAEAPPSENSRLVGRSRPASVPKGNLVYNLVTTRPITS